MKEKHFNRFDIYKLLLNKQPYNLDDLLNFDSTKCVTFLNPFSIEQIKEKDLYERFDYICSDGIIPVLINNFFSRKKIKRISFDMSSLAKEVFSKAQKEEQTIYIVGSTIENVGKFKCVVEDYFPNIRIVGISDGYFGATSQIIERIIKSECKIVIVGMGYPNQDIFSIQLISAGFSGMVFTCGGFIHQTTSRINYYPRIFDKLNLRSLYRIYKEPKVVSRLIRYYPPFILKFTLFCIIEKSKTIFHWLSN